MKFNLDRNAYAYLHDALYDVFDQSFNHSQIDKLFELHPAWDGVMDTLGRGELMDKICFHFIQMKVPIYNDTQEFEDEFHRKIAENKDRFLAYINN